MLTQYTNDFDGYCRDVLGLQLWEVESRIGNSVRDNPRTAVSGCHASGKTFVAGAIANWWLDTRSPAIVLNTAPVGRQAKLGVFREAGKARRKAKMKLPGRIMTAEVRISEERFLLAFSADNPDSVQGLREACNVLVIEDEATGVDDDMVEALETVLTDPSSRYLMQGNPISQAGHFFAAFHAQKHLWNCIEINAFDTPNVQAGRIVVPGLISKEFVESRRLKWGEDSPLWHQRILGKFYILAGATKLIARDWIEMAGQRFDPSRAGLSGGTMAVDIAASEAGDRTSNYYMAERQIEEVETYHEPNLITNASRIVQKAIAYGARRLIIDATGLGRGCFQEVQRIAEKLLPDVEVLGVNLGDAATDPKLYRRKLSELQWLMRRAFDPNGDAPVAIDPRDTDLAEQLGWRQWELIDGMICVETKNKLRQRTNKSPDKADAVMLLFYEGRRFEFA